MSPSAEQKLFDVLIPDLTRWEGAFRHMYLDTRGLVTTGIGNLVPSANAAAELPFIVLPYGAPASDTEKRTAWAAVKGMPQGMRAGAYESASNLRLTNESVGDLVAGRLRDEFLPGIRRLFPRFDAFPLQAKQALVDLAYNCGLDGLAGFHHMGESVLEQDWLSASKRCHRSSSREERNDWCAAMFEAAAKQPVFIS